MKSIETHLQRKESFFSEAIVVSNRDPKGQERLLIQIPGYHNMNLDQFSGNSTWAKHVASDKFKSGGLPSKGDILFVVLPDKSNPEYCFWLGVLRFSVQSFLSENYEIDDKKEDNEPIAEQLTYIESDV